LNTIFNITKNLNKSITVNEWVLSIRLLGKVGFIILKNRDGDLQIVVKDPKLLNDIKAITIESCISVTGVANENKVARNGFEIIAEEINPYAISEAIPIDTSEKIDSNLSTRLNYRYLDIRNLEKAATFKLISKISFYVYEYFQEKGFILKSCI